MSRLWLWLVGLGLVILVLGTLGWLAGTSEEWYALLGASVLISGLSMRRR
ncbi:MAG: hypothetical protein AB1449_14725 [Chloroflexota bacterium]